MSLCHEIVTARKYGAVRCGLSAQASPTVAELATEFGLLADPAKYVEISSASARSILELLLTHDMAYGVEIMPAARATELTERFLAQFGADGVRYYTNAVFDKTQPAGPPWSSARWTPMTTATFDSGVLIMAPELSGCVWVEDED
jgi:hypothetical protein